MLLTQLEKTDIKPSKEDNEMIVFMPESCFNSKKHDKPENIVLIVMVLVFVSFCLSLESV